MPNLALDSGTTWGSARTQEEYDLSFPNGHILLDPPGSGYQLLCALHALRHSIFHQFPDLPAPTIEHLHDLALKGDVARAIRDTGEAVDENFFAVGQVAGILQQYGEEHGQNMQLAVHRAGELSYIQTREGLARTLWIHHEGNHYTAMAARAAAARETPRSPPRRAFESATSDVEQNQDLPPKDASTSPQGVGSDSAMTDIPGSRNDEASPSRSTVQSLVPPFPADGAQDVFQMPEVSYDELRCQHCNWVFSWEDYLRGGQLCLCIP